MKGAIDGNVSVRDSRVMIKEKCEGTFEAKGEIRTTESYPIKKGNGFGLGETNRIIINRTC